MKKIILDNCPACTPINELIHGLEKNGFKVIESRLEDYHFHQLYLRVNTTIENAKKLNIEGLTEKDNFLICDCHWSRIEFETERLE